MYICEAASDASDYFVDEIPTRDVSQELDSPVISQSKTGVAYITENLIKKLTHEDNLGNITKLYLILGKDLKKKFKVSASIALSCR